VNGLHLYPAQSSFVLIRKGSFWETITPVTGKVNLESEQIRLNNYLLSCVPILCEIYILYVLYFYIFLHILRYSEGKTYTYRSEDAYVLVHTVDIQGKNKMYIYVRTVCRDRIRR
jgi:hypothetical protein